MNDTPKNINSSWKQRALEYFLFLAGIVVIVALISGGA